MAKKRVLITGMSGLIGGLAQRQLEEAYELRALNRSVVEGVDCVQADIAHLTAILPAFEDVDTVVHLAAIATAGATWPQILQANLIGTYNVFEAARRCGAKRVVYASSGATISNCELAMPYGGLVDRSH
ncbi:MAG: NAD(P)-dependent oxidoreductase [Caldilineaceae bacterium]|nr:NAD(P)-dependent oxidoreductase [Caldilineaceae bacterium]